MKLHYLSIAALTLIATASCNDDSERTYSLFGYFTIDGNISYGYTLYADGGGIVMPTNTSICNITGSTDGFKSGMTRGAFYVTYKDSDIKKQNDGTSIIQNASFTGGNYLRNNKIMTLQEAEEKLYTSSDSTFNVSSVKEFWAYRGYLNTIITADYSYLNTGGVYPAFNMTYQPDSVRAHENELHLKLFYNRHTPKSGVSSYSNQFVESYSLSELGYMIPGSDSVQVYLDVEGSQTVKIKVAREDFRTGNYKGFSSL